MKKTGLRGKFLFPTICLILAGLSLTSYVSYRNARAMLVDTVNDQLRQNTESIRDFVASWSENRRRDVAQWASQGSIGLAVAMIGDYTGGAEGLSGSAVLVNEVNADLRKYAQANPDYAEIGIASQSGSVITSSLIAMGTDWSARVEGGGLTVAGRNIRATDYFEHAIRGSDFVSMVQRNPDTGKPIFVIASPIKQGSAGSQQAAIGILYAMIDVEYFSRKFVEQRKIGRQGRVFIIDREGMVIAHSDQSRILAENIAKTSIGGTILAQKDGLAQSFEGGQDWLVAFKTDTALGWTVVAVASMDELMAPVRQTALLNFVMTVVILIIAIGVIIYVAARVSAPINSVSASLYLVARQVAGASSQISSASQQLAQGASAQASSIEETSASLEELASMANHNADNAQQASSLSQEATQAANSGAEAMDKLMRSMEGISASSSEVAKVAKGIEEIAFQTNLLALNAAVEAARAGEAGRGFAVVADEVRNLAQRASGQARVTSTLITESANRTREGGKQAAEAHGVLKVIQERVAQVVGLVSEISAASREQALGVGQINKAVSTMEHIVQQNSANAEQSASASQQLTAQAFQMKELVSTLSERVTGSAADAGEFDEDRTAHRLSGAAATRPATPASAAILPAAGKRPEPAGASAKELIPFEDDALSDF